MNVFYLTYTDELNEQIFLSMYIAAKDINKALDYYKSVFKFNVPFKELECTYDEASEYIGCYKKNVKVEEGILYCIFVNKDKTAYFYNKGVDLVSLGIELFPEEDITQISFKCVPFII